MAGLTPQRRRPAVLFCEIVERRTGLWCPTCALPSGVAITLAGHWHGGVLTVATAAMCVDCASPLRPTSTEE